MSKQESQFSDTPLHTEGQTSSIGGIWPPVRAYAERIKAFYNLRPIVADRCLCVLRQRFLRECQRLDGENISRVQFRGIFGDKFLKSSYTDYFLQENVEAIIPLERFEQDQQLVIAYLGYNHPSRRSAPQDLAVADSNIQSVRGIPAKTATEIIERALTNGYSVEVLDKSRDPVRNIQQLGELYSRFNWSIEDVIKIYSDPSNLIAVARDRGVIVSAGIAETARIPFPGSDLRIAEITEAATHNDHGNQGLYTAVSTLLLKELAIKSSKRQIFAGSLDLVFGECNVLSPGVLRAVRHQGRTFSNEICADYGFPGRGILHQQVEIKGAVKQTPYNDLLPAFLLPGTLYQRYL